MSLLALSLGAALAASPTEPQGHQGILSPIRSAPAPVALTAEDDARLRRGEAVLRTSKGESGGTGVAVQYIAAEADRVWDTILAYERYPDWVDNVVSATIYRREGDRFWLDMQSSVVGFKTVLYTVNTLHRDQGWMSWTLDYARSSDVEDMVGYWRVEALSAQPPLTKLEYGTELVVRGVPGFVVRYLTQESLTDGTAWVKREAER